MADRVRPRRVTSREDRKRPSVFTRLKAGESFRGHALFEPDPELSDNPGFFEYFSHWDQERSRYVPCAGAKCPFCLANDNPGTQAATVWYFPHEDAKDQIKIFTMNKSTVDDITDIADEEEGIIGKGFRVKRISDRGEYRVRPLTDKPLTKKQIDDLLKKAPDLEEIISRQLQAEWEAIKALSALSDDGDSEDEEEEEERPARRGRPRARAQEEEPEEESEESEEDEEEDEDEDEEPEASSDEDEDEDEDDEEAEEEEELTSATFKVVLPNQTNETVEATSDEYGKMKFWVASGVDVDWDAVVKGATVVISAEKDEEGDWVATSIEAAEAPKRKTARRR